MMERDAAGEAEIDQLMKTIPPMDATVAAGLLREAKEVFDELGVVFFLRQGTCLGAVRDGAFIPWDDDLDLGSIYGMHGLTKRSVASVADAFRARGFHVKEATSGGESWLGIMKRHIRIDWICYRVRKGRIVHFPNVSIPVELFARLQEVDFVGERFLVPSPPEEYLRCKYGPYWATPKRIGYEKDVVDNLPAEQPAWPRRLRRFLEARLAGRTAVLRVLGEHGEPIADGEVAVAGLSRSRTDGNGDARCYVPREDVYALVVRAGGREEVLYEEQLAPGRRYVYRPDADRPAGRIFVLTEER